VAQIGNARARHAERRAQPGGFADEHEPALVRHVEPLVRVGGDAVGVHVQPGAELLGQVGDVGQRVEVARVGFPGGGRQYRRRAGQLPQPQP
jgi:hypothetical protein